MEIHRLVSTPKTLHIFIKTTKKNYGEINPLPSDPNFNLAGVQLSVKPIHSTCATILYIIKRTIKQMREILFWFNTKRKQMTIV